MADLADRAIEAMGRLARWAGADVRFFREGSVRHVAARAGGGGAHLMEVAVRKNGEGFDGWVVMPEDSSVSV